ncbi:MAG: GNAT family N-acetyltransferase, partial [Verrucomicrobiota bacterium]
MDYKALQKNRFTAGDYSIAPIREEDMEPIRQWRNAQVEVLRQKGELTPEAQARYYREVVRPLFDLDEPEQLLFSYFLAGALIGYGGLVHLSWPDRRAEMSFLVSPERALEPALYEEAMRHFITLMKQVCFEELAFNRLRTETYGFRHQTLAILEAGGFVREGVMRDHVI